MLGVAVALADVSSWACMLIRRWRVISLEFDDMKKVGEIDCGKRVEDVMELHFFNHLILVSHILFD